MITNCILTNSDTEIIRPWFVIPDYFSKKVDIHTGVDIVASNVYSLCNGTVIWKETDISNHVIVTIQYDSAVLFRFCNLSFSYVDPGDNVIRGQLLGQADRFIHFEKLSPNPPKVSIAVNIYNTIYYKVDPTEYVDGTIQLLSPTSYDPYQFQLK